MVIFCPSSGYDSARIWLYISVSVIMLILDRTIRKGPPRLVQMLTYLDNHSLCISRVCFFGTRIASRDTY